MWGVLSLLLGIAAIPAYQVHPALCVVALVAGFAAATRWGGPR